MIVNATDLKNNLGKYLRASAKEEVIITSNGRKIAKLMAYEDGDERDFYENYLREKEEAYSLIPKKISFEEFLRMTETSEEQYEYIDGEIYLMASPDAVHQQILGELYVTLYNWFKGKQCKPMLAPFDITLKRSEENKNVVQPDIMVICDLEDKLDGKKKYTGVPSLMIEILSESTRGKDMVKKLDLYMSTGVQEYWIVNPFKKEVTVYSFDNLDVTQNATFGKNQKITSYIFDGLEVSLSDIFQG